ncbi:MAG: hypothetical protein B6229_05980 [Spirochaetaceae bacterium 4572_7]|nr:MAG: hypothetical protein B6229_05980 [Spirochaetaceae bacterium 4572_7]
MLRKILKDIECLESLSHYLEPNGPLSIIDNNYEYRESQAKLLDDITHALNHDCILAAEAGTGVGKSFAYLLPALKWAEVKL